jgi:hypothetical protein
MPEAVSQLAVGSRRNGNRSLSSGHPGGVPGLLHFSVFLVFAAGSMHAAPNLHQDEFISSLANQVNKLFRALN